MLLKEQPAPRIIVNDRPPPVRHPAVATLSLGIPVPAPKSNTASIDSPTPAAISSEPRLFSLKRTRSYQTFGPLKLKLGKTEPVRGLCDLRVEVGPRSFVHRNVRLDEALWVALPKGNSAAQIVLTRMEPDRVSGFWTEGDRPARKQVPRR